MSKHDDDDEQLGRIDAELEAERRLRAAADSLTNAINNENAAAWVLAEAVDVDEGTGILTDHILAALSNYRARRNEANAKRASMRRLSRLRGNR